jgi:hypothetical protein
VRDGRLDLTSSAMTRPPPPFAILDAIVVSNIGDQFIAPRFNKALDSSLSSVAPNAQLVLR